MKPTKPDRSEKGQAGLEFVIIMPVLLMALLLVTVVGNQLYQKLSSQAFVYSYCMWDVSNIGVAHWDTSFTSTVDTTKKTWSTEGVWQDFPTFPKNRVVLGESDFFVEKTCTASVTYDEWWRVGFGHIFSYDPNSVVESTMTVIKPNYVNLLDKYPVPLDSPLLLWGGE